MWTAHSEAKRDLLARVQSQTGVVMDPDVLTIGLARRFTAYKRLDLIFRDVERLQQVSRETGRLQIICAGKAHPRDADGKFLLQRIFQMREVLKDEIAVVCLPNYDLDLAKLLTSGVDLWLNTPQPPLEASGTSGMKAALNGVPSLSVLDGWWIEGCIEGVTGWSIGKLQRDHSTAADSDADAACLYAKLANEIVPVFYRQHERFVDIMRHAIALNGSFFNTQRMLHQYVLSAYFR